MSNFMDTITRKTRGSSGSPLSMTARKSSSAISSSRPNSYILLILKNASVIFMIVAFLFGMIIVPYQQRHILATVLLQEVVAHQSPNNQPILTQNSSDDQIIGVRLVTNTAFGAVTADGTESKPTVQIIQAEMIRTDETSKDDFSGVIARPFLSWPNDKGLPCYPSSADWTDMKVQFTPTNRGFLYVKPYKTGSSTTSGVHLRIARNVAKRRTKVNTTMCATRHDHGPDYYPGYTLFRNRIRKKSFLWTILRNPTKRAVSQFFHFEVSRNKIEPTDQNFVSFLRTKDPMEDYYLRTLYPQRKFDRQSINPITAANTILRSYNFIGITERLDESFVVLMMILKLKIADILYLSAKTKGGYDDAGGRDSKTCTYIWPSFVSPGVDKFLSSKEWRNTTRYDTLLYEAVNRSLDMTIDSLGRDRFDRKLRKFQRAQQVAHTKCLPTTIFPCDATGIYNREETTDCIWKDSGCGATCLDEVATELNLW
jgi:Galactose-3-O-sulfotransferase